MSILGWIDRNLWSVPVLVFTVVGVTLGLWSAVSSRPVLLTAASPPARQAVYASLTGSASAFFAAALAVVAILMIFPRLAATGFEEALARARVGAVGVLLTASCFIGLVVVVATIAIPVDTKQAGNAVITTLIEAAAMAGVVGLIVGGVGLALVIVERSRR